MNPIETLTSLDDLRRELHCQREKIDSLEEAARYLSPVGDSIGRRTTIPSDRVGKMAAQIADEKAELERMEDRYSRAVTAAVKVLDRLSDLPEREVLAKRYIAGMKWNQVAQILDYDISTCHRIKRNAFIKLATQYHTMPYNTT